MSEDEEKEIGPIFTEKCFYCVYNLRVLEHFVT